jgi:hypothetical protein
MTEQDLDVEMGAIEPPPSPASPLSYEAEAEVSPPAAPSSRSTERTDTTSESYLDKRFRDHCISKIQPALERDIDDMVRGRVIWRRIAIVAETGGKLLTGASTVLAYAASWDDVNQSVLSFVAGTAGTVGIVSTMFATFSRQQALERAQAINHVFKSVRLKTMPDIVTTLDIQGGKE